METGTWATFRTSFFTIFLLISVFALPGCGGDSSNGDQPNSTDTTYYRDADGDGYGDPASSQAATSQPAGYVTDGTDCDDASAATNPGATEIADGIDNNCNGQVDEGFTTYYRDADGDGYGDPNVSQTTASQPTGFVTNNTDCDDTNVAINPGATEVAGDGIDNNCNGEVDEGGGTGGTGGSVTTETGVFHDSFVEGLRYEHRLGEGITNAQGEYTYLPYETISFSLGGISLGNATGSPVITPLDLATWFPYSGNAPKLTNILRLLQTLDNDGDPANGILIPQDTLKSLESQTLDLSLATADFESAFATLSGAVLGDVSLVDVAIARKHFQQTLEVLSGQTSLVYAQGEDIQGKERVFVPNESYSSNVSGYSAQWHGFGDRAILGSATSMSMVLSDSGRVVSISYFFQPDITNRRNNSFEYELFCKVTALPSSCNRIAVDLQEKSITFDNVVLDVDATPIFGDSNLATAPLRLDGVLYW